jgi:hypothetical protein
MRYFVTLKTGAYEDGWVPPELWEEAKSIHDKLYNMLLVEVVKNKDDEDKFFRDETSLRKYGPLTLKIDEVSACAHGSLASFDTVGDG